MQGFTRRQEVAAVSSKDPDVAELLKRGVLVNDPTEHDNRPSSVWLHHTPSYTSSIEVETSAVAGDALVWLWTDTDTGKQVLDYFRVSAADLCNFAAQLSNLSTAITDAQQAALEADCDRREEIQRLGHEA